MVVGNITIRNRTHACLSKGITFGDQFYITNTGLPSAHVAWVQKKYAVFKRDGISSSIASFWG